MAQNVASDQGLHCLLTGNSMQNTIKMKSYIIKMKSYTLKLVREELVTVNSNNCLPVFSGPRFLLVISHFHLMSFEKCPQHSSSATNQI